MTHRTRGTGRAWASAAPGPTGGGRMPPPQRTPQPAHPPSGHSAVSPSATKHALAGGCGELSTSKARRSGRRACAAQPRRRRLPRTAWSSPLRPPLPADPQRLCGLRGHRRSPPRTGSARRRASVQSTPLVQSAGGTGWLGGRTPKSPQKSQPEARRRAAAQPARSKAGLSRQGQRPGLVHEDGRDSPRGRLGLANWRCSNGPPTGSPRRPRVRRSSGRRPQRR